MQIENITTYDDILEARRAVVFLKKHGLINKDQEIELNKQIDEKETSEMWFITKPFRYNEGQSKTAYHFMIHIIHKFRDSEVFNEDR